METLFWDEVWPQKKYGVGGVDQDVAKLLGGRFIGVQGEKENKIHPDVFGSKEVGICFGISIAWVIAFIHGNTEVKDIALFREYFVDTLSYKEQLKPLL